MNYFVLGAWVLTVVFILSGFLCGLIRGRNRSILRVCLVVVCAVAAFFLRTVVADAIMGIETNGETLLEMLQNSFTSSEMSAEMTDIICAVVEGLIGAVCFIILFVALRFVTWALIYPFLKLAVKKEDKRTDEEKEIAKQNLLNEGKKKYKPALKRWWGALVGSLQGVLIAFLVLVPLTGMLGTVGSLTALMPEEESASTEYVQTLSANDEKALSLYEQEGSGSSSSEGFDFSSLGLDEFSNSFIYRTFNFTGRWFYSAVSAAEYETVEIDENGEEKTVTKSVSVAAVGEIVKAAQKIMTEVEDLQKVVEELGEEGGATKENYEALGDSLIKVGNALNSLPGDAKTLLDDLGSALIGMIGDSSDDGMEFPEDFKFSNLDLASIGELIRDIAPYAANDFEEERELTEDLAEDMVDCIAKNMDIFEMIMDSEGGDSDEAFIALPEEYHDIMLNAINGNSADQETKNKIKDIFGIK